MTTYSNALVVYEDGRLKKVESTDTIDLSGSLTLGGDLNVQGDIVSTGATNVLVTDAFIDMGSGYTETGTARSAGFTFNVKAAGTAETGTDFVAGVVSTSAPRITVSAPTAFVAGDIIQVSGAAIPANDGLYIVAGVSGSDIDLYGVGGTAVPGYALFAQSQVEASTANTATLTKVNLSVLAVSDGVNVKDSAGVAIPVGTLASAYYAPATLASFNGTGAGTGYIKFSGVTLQDAYDASSPNGTINLASGKNFQVFPPGVGTARIRLNSNGVSNFTVDSANLTLNTTTSGTLTVSSAASMNITATTFLSVEASTINLGSSVAAGSMAFGSSGDRSILIGNVGGATSVAIRAGSGNVAVISDGTVAINASGASIDIGNAVDNSAINVGTAGSRVITVGNTNVGSTVDIKAGTGGTGITLTGDVTGTSYIRTGQFDTGSLPAGSYAGALAYNIDLGALGQPVWHNGVTWQSFSSLTPATTLQGAYDASSSPATILLANGKNFVVDKPTSGSAGFSLNAFGAGGTLEVEDSTLTLNSVRTSTGGAISMTAGGSMNISTNLGQMTFSTAAAKIVMTADYNSASTGEIRIRSQNSGAGGAEFTAKAKTYVRIGAGSVTEPNYDITFDSPNKAVNLQAKENTSFINIGTSAYDTTVQLGQYLVKFLSQAQLLNADNATLTALPQFLGSIAFDTDANEPVFFDGSIWKSFGSIAVVSLQSAYVGGNTISLSGTEGDLAVSVGSGTAAVTIDTNKNSRFSVAGANLTLSTTTSGNLFVSSAAQLQVTADDFISVNTTSQAILIGNSSATTQMDFGTGGTRFITVGNANPLTSVAIAAGTGGLTLDATGVAEINSSGAAISIGNDAVNQAINIGTAGARTITIGNTTALTAVAINAGSGGMTLDSVAALELNAVSAAISIGNDARNQPINIGTAGARTITIGNSGVGTGLDIQAGTAGISMQTSTAGITIATNTAGVIALLGSTGVDINGTTGPINIGQNPDNQPINIGTGGTRSIKLGSTTAPTLLGQSSANQAAAGTYLPVGASSGITTGEVLYINTSGELDKADGDGTGTRDVVGAALETAGGGAGDLRVATVPGSVIPMKFTSGPSGSDVGKPVYLSTTAGLATSTAPVSGRVYRLGVLLSSTADGLGNYRVLYVPNFVADL